MLAYIVKRLAFTLIQLVFVATATFLLLRLLPADPVSRLIGINPSKAAYAIAQRSLGLDHPLGEQLVLFLRGLLTGSLGTSWNTSRPVTAELAQRLPVTLEFVVPAFLLALIVAVPIGLLVASRPGGKLDRTILAYSLFAGAQPDFWWGLMFIFLLYFVAHIFPAPLGLTEPGNLVPPAVTNFLPIDALLAGDQYVFLDVMRHLALPILTLAFILSGPIIKMTRESAESVFGSDYILYARACGFPQGVIRRQMLKSAVAPVLTLVGILFGFMLGGAVLIENVFSLNGIGTYALQRTLTLDYPAVQGAVVVMTAFALGVYLVMDLLHSFLDPRLTLS